MSRNEVTVRVPGSTSNLGSGFDTLGLAVRLYNWMRVRRSARGSITSSLPGSEPGATARLVSDAAAAFFRKTGQTPFSFRVEMGGDIPIGRGLGASATARVGIVAALNQLAHTRLSRHQIMELVTAIEGHPDNASPCVFGGFTVSGKVGDGVRCLRFSVRERFKLVTLIPPFHINTEESRKLIPKIYSRPDTAHSLNRAALITAGFASGTLNQLRGLFDDRIHQPYREKLIPQLSAVIRAGEAAGAIGGWLSGSGSAIMCLGASGTNAIAAAMLRELPGSEMLILSADNRGLTMSS
jgi:homoserine kinase